MSARVDFAYTLREQAALNARMCQPLYGPLGRWGVVLIAACIERMIPEALRKSGMA